MCALIRTGSVVVTEISGKVGGQSYSRNGGGAYVRNISKPLNGQTSAQTAVRSSVATLSRAWAGLTAAQQAAWNSFGALQIKTNRIGHKSPQTGFNAFVQYNQVLANAGIAQISVPPSTVSIAALTSLSLTAVHAGATTVTYAATPVPANQNLLIQTTGNLSAGKSFVKNRFRTIHYAAAAAASPYVATTAQNAKWGAPTLGSKIFVRAYMIDIVGGYKSLPLIASAIVS
jgi:hypothetical protein